MKIFFSIPILSIPISQKGIGNALAIARGMFVTAFIQGDRCLPSELLSGIKFKYYL